MKRLLYFGYYIKNLDWKKFKKFLNYVIEKENKNKIFILIDIIYSSFKYNISILEYFQFGFYRLKKEDRKKWVGTGYIYEYQLKMNPPAKRNILDNKTIFFEKYKPFILHKQININDLKTDYYSGKKILNNKAGKVVFKLSNGKCGFQVKVVNANGFDESLLLRFMEKNNYDLVEEYIIQHPDLMALSPSGVNTVRIITQLNKNNEVEILGCRLRISVNSPVDNMASGNIVAPLDEKTGIVTGPAVYSDITKSEVYEHPVTKVPIVGFKIPFWKETIQLAKDAALLHPENRSIGWDIVLTSKGPGLIEGNHDWCKLVWQLPVKRGLKPILERHLKEFKEIKNVNI